MVAFIKKAKETYQNIIIHAPSVLEDELLTSAKPYADTVLMVVTSGLNNTNEVIQSYNKLIDLEVFPIESLVYETKVSFNKLFSFLKK
jgi:Mrp family chromosome partitioning ATPase